jgi:hypothetical protein
MGESIFPSSYRIYCNGSGLVAEKYGRNLVIPAVFSGNPLLHTAMDAR